MPGLAVGVTAVLALLALAPVKGLAAEQSAGEPDYALRMSTSLTFDAVPATPAPAAIESAAPDTIPAPAGSSGYLLATLCAALGLVCGLWLAWRRPADLTPAQDRLGAELMRTRERYLGLLNQRGTRHDPAWDSTLTTLHADLANLRSLADRLHDEKSALETTLAQRDEQGREAAQTRVSLEERLESAREAMARAQSEHKGVLARTLALYEEEQARALQLQTELQAAHREIASQQSDIERLTQRATQADTQRERAATLDVAIASANAALEEARQNITDLEKNAAQTEADMAAMVDKNVALDTTLSQLKESQRRAEESYAEREKTLLEQLRDAKESGAAQESEFLRSLSTARSEHTRSVAALEQTLAEERAEREQSLETARQELAAALEQAALSDQAKRRVLSILQQEKAAAGETRDELDALRLEYTAALEHNDAMQKMLSTAEDRIDDQETKIADLNDETQLLRREAQVREQDLSDARADREQHGEQDGTLADAGLALRRLQDDLRLRDDLVDALRTEVEAQAQARAALSERDQTIAVLENELAMALGEASRLRQIDRTTPRATPRDLVMLRERVDGLEERIRAKEKEIAILRAAANDDIDDGPLQNHVARIEREHEASIAVARFLQGEVKKLSADLRKTTPVN